MKILVINPGSTSTKIAVYENETPLFVSNIKHTVEELSVYPQVIDQFEFRKNLVLKELESNGIPFAFDAVIGRGGLVKPIPGGVYEVNEAMVRDTLHAMRTHACNLGGLIAKELASSRLSCFHCRPGSCRRTGRYSPYYRFSIDAENHHLACIESKGDSPAFCQRAGNKV